MAFGIDPVSATKNLQGGFSYLAQEGMRRRQQEDQFQQAMRMAQAEAELKQRMQQQDPYYQFIQKAELASKLKAMSDLGVDISPYAGIFGGGQASPQVPQQFSQGGQPIDVQARGLPVGDEELTPTQYDVNPLTGQLRPKEFKNLTAEARGDAIKASEKEKVTNISKLNRLNTIVDSIAGEWQKTTPPGSKTRAFPVIGRGLGMLSRVGASLQATPGQREDSAYLSFVKGIRAQLARSLGDVGNLSEFEQKAVLDLIPGIADDYETGLNKIQKLKTLIANIKGSASKNINEIESIGSNEDPLGLR